MNSQIKISRETVSTAKKRLLKMHFESGVGHIGGNLSALDAMLVVFHEYLGTHNKFVLSKGHAAGALYTTLWSVGQLNDHDLTTFHKDGTLLVGHPPAKGISDISFATGSLGHGLSLASGMALGFKLNGNSSRVFCLTSDGEWQEGSTWEALIFACHHQLTNLTIMVDHNELQGFGTTTEVASMSPLWDKLAGFNVDIKIIDGHDIEAIRGALKQRPNKIQIIILQTVKGHGISFMANKMEWHYLPMTETQFQIAIAEIDSP